MDVNQYCCKIILFIDEDDSDVSLWSEIVPAKEKTVKATLKKRRKDGLTELSTCISRPVMVKNFERIRIEIPVDVGITIPPTASKEPPVLWYDQKNYENFHRLSIIRNKRHQNEQAIVKYRRIHAPHDLLHEAQFGAYEFFTRTKLYQPRLTNTAHHAMFDDRRSLFVLSDQLSVTQMTKLGFLLNLEGNKIDELHVIYEGDHASLKMSILLSWLKNIPRFSFERKVKNLTEGLESLQLRTISEVAIAVASENRAFKPEDFDTR